MKHVVGGHLSPGHRVVPVFEGQVLVAVEDVRGPRHVAGDEDVVGHHAIDVVRAATGVAAHAPLTGRQASAVEPFHVADRPQRGMTTSTSSTVPSDSVADRTCPDSSPFSDFTDTPVRRSTPGVAHHVRRDVTDHAAQGAAQ